MRAGRSQFNVAEALAADFAQRDFYAALVANDAPVLHPLVLAAQTLPVGDGAENLRAKQAVPLGLERTVIDGLRLGDFAVRPRSNFLRTCQADPNGIEISNQAGAIIRAATIQGCFLPPWLSPGPRSNVSGTSDRLRTRLPETANSLRVLPWGRAKARP